MTPISGRVLRAIDNLLDALNSGELIARDCWSCAVATLVKAGGVEHQNAGNWVSAWSYSTKFVKLDLCESEAHCINATEFTAHELMLIEGAFERSISGLRASYRPELLKGIRAVFQVMLSFDNPESEAEADAVFQDRVDARAETFAGGAS